MAVVAALPHQSAWRVIMAAAEPGRLIQSNVITSLNPPSAIKDASWIRPGKAAWDWWSGSVGSSGNREFTTDGLKYYVDLAARSDSNTCWSTRAGPIGRTSRMNGRVDIPELVKYAAAKGVRVWIWCHSNAVEQQMEQAFPLFETWGVAGVKIDFLSRDDQKMIDFYYRVAEKAAQHHLMVDFHGSTKPTGLERTYPNVLGYEAVLGLEQSKAGTRDNPDHHVTLPFTRMLAGPMDVTPGGFDNVTKAEFQPRNSRPMVMGTRAHQLAMYVVYDAPFQMVADHPGATKISRRLISSRACPPRGTKRTCSTDCPASSHGRARARPGLVHRQHDQLAAADTRDPAVIPRQRQLRGGDLCRRGRRGPQPEERRHPAAARRPRYSPEGAAHGRGLCRVDQAGEISSSSCA